MGGLRRVQVRAAGRAAQALVLALAACAGSSSLSLAQTGTFTASTGQPWIDVTGQGAYIDAQTSCSATVALFSGPTYTVTLTAPSSFSTAFIGEEVWLQSTGSAPALGTITIVSSALVAMVAVSSGTPNTTLTSCVTWGHDDTSALQAALNLLNAPPFNGVGGEIKIPHGRTGLMMIGQQSANLTGGTGGGGVNNVSTVTVGANQTFATAVGATVTVAYCGGGTGVSFNGTWVVSGWNAANGQISYNQASRSSGDSCTGGTVTETGVYAPTQSAYVIEAESKTGSSPGVGSGAQLLGAFPNGFIMNIGERGTNLNPAPRIEGLQFEDVSGTGASPGGLLCAQCLNGEFVGLAFNNFNGITSLDAGQIKILSAGLAFSSSLTGGDFVTTSVGTAPLQIFQPDTEINSVYDLQCTLNAVCIDAGSTIGSTQDGPHIYGGYIHVGNHLNQKEGDSSTTPNTQSCTGIWAAGRSAITEA